MSETQSNSESEKSPYAWLLFGDLSTGNTGARVWQSGPDPDNFRVNMHEVLEHGKCFRLVNDNGVAMYEGYIIGEYTGEEPLKEYGLDHGCVSIEYEGL